MYFPTITNHHHRLCPRRNCHSRLFDDAEQLFPRQTVQSKSRMAHRLPQQRSQCRWRLQTKLYSQHLSRMLRLDKQKRTFLGGQSEQEMSQGDFLQERCLHEWLCLSLSCVDGGPVYMERGKCKRWNWGERRAEFYGGCYWSCSFRSLVDRFGMQKPPPRRLAYGVIIQNQGCKD